MAEQEDSVMRGASKKGGKKRVASAALGQSHIQSHANKKRAVLGELTNIPSAEFTRCESIDYANPKSRISKPRKTATAAATTEKNKDEEPPADEKCCYAPSIYQHLHSLELEEKRRPLVDYMRRIQKDLTAGMREILIDWLVEVADEYKLVSDTLYLTVSYIDRFLSTRAISRNKLQLLGVSCMLVASKYEEITPPHVEDFCYITDNTYKKEEVLDMERDILKFLNFELGSPTSKTFLRVFMKAAQVDPNSPDLKLEFMGSYLTDLSLVDYGCVGFLPSVVAASAVFLANFTINPKIHPWTLALQQCSGYKPSELRECVLFIHELQLAKRKISSSAVREKYSQSKYKRVASFSSPPEIPSPYFEDL